MKNILRMAVLLTPTLMLSMNANAQQILIDSYETDQGPLIDNTASDDYGSGLSTQVMGDGLIGGYRDLYVQEIIYEPGNGFSGNGIDVEIGGGSLNVDIGNLASGFTIMTYDGANEVGNDWLGNVDVDGLGGEDFSFVENLFYQGVYNDTVAPVTLAIWTDDNNDNNWVKHVLEFQTQALSTQEEPHYDALIPVQGFTDFANINWGRVGAFQAGFNVGNSVRVGSISADLSVQDSSGVSISEPMPLSMLGAGLLMMGFLNYRRKDVK